MAEWLKATVLKTVVGLRLPWVRIPLSPHFFKIYFMNNLKQKIKLLYPRKADYVYDKVEQMILDFNKINNNKTNNNKTNNKALFTEKDIMLICYPDHVQEKGIKTLKTMNKFLRKYAKNIINRIHFLPFYPYSSDDGFSVIDYYKVNKKYGDWDDFKKINQNFSFMFDLVINHISAKSKWFKKFLVGDEYYKNFFIAFDKKIDTSKVFRPRVSPLLSKFKTKHGNKYVWTTFSKDQIDLNFNNEEVFLEILKILFFYINHGAKSIRLDAIAYVWKEAGTPCFNHHKTHILTQLFHDILKKIDPNVWIITETVLSHKENISYFGNGKNEAHLVYNFALETLFLSMFLKQDSSIASRWINSIKNTSDQNSFLNLSVSHDGIHTIPVKGILSIKDMNEIADDVKKKQGQILYRSVLNKDPEPYEFNITYFSAIGNIDAFLASQAIQLALRGIPLIYFNNLIGAENWTEGVEKLGYSRAINRQKFNYKKLTKELNNTNSTKYKVYNQYIKMIKVRINESLFSPLVKQKILNINKQVLVIHRYKNKNNNLIAITNISNKKVSIKTEKIKKILLKNKVLDILSKKSINLKSNTELNPYQILWLK